MSHVSRPEIVVPKRPSARSFVCWSYLAVLGFVFMTLSTVQAAARSSADDRQIMPPLERVKIMRTGDRGNEAASEQPVMAELRFALSVIGDSHPSFAAGLMGLLVCALTRFFLSPNSAAAKARGKIG